MFKNLNPVEINVNHPIARDGRNLGHWIIAWYLNYRRKLCRPSDHRLEHARPSDHALDRCLKPNQNRKKRQPLDLDWEPP